MQFHSLPHEKQEGITLFLHFNLVEFKPLTTQVTLRSILHSGQFAGKMRVILKCLLRQLPIETVRKELEQQLRRAMDGGLSINGIDSHQHMHALGPISEAVTKITEEYHLAFVRSYSQMTCQTLMGSIKLGIFQFGSILTSRRLHSPASWKRQAWRPFAVASWEPIVLSKLPPETLLVCHPGSIWDKPVTPPYDA
jgi:predicted glycoside hydrolase/deacetylase ChbG (UPF0249 family)